MTRKLFPECAGDWLLKSYPDAPDEQERCTMAGWEMTKMLLARVELVKRQWMQTPVGVGPLDIAYRQLHLLLRHDFSVFRHFGAMADATEVIAVESFARCLGFEAFAHASFDPDVFDRNHATGGISCTTCAARGGNGDVKP